MGGNEGRKRKKGKEGREKGGNRKEKRKKRIIQHSKRAEINEFQAMTRTFWGLQKEFNRPCFSGA